MSLEKAIYNLAAAINNHAEALRTFNGANVAPAAVPLPEVPAEPAVEAVAEDKPKRGRRSKAEIEAAKAAEEVKEEVAETPAEEVKEEVAETPAEEVKEEAVAEEPVQEEVKEEPSKPYELSDIQKALMKIAALGEDARRAAKGIPLSLGYAKSADVPKDKYPEMVKGIYQVNKEIAEAVWGKR